MVCHLILLVHHSHTRGILRDSAITLPALPAWPCSQVSPECQELIGKMLVADPDERSSLQDIQQHPWFQKGLPNGYLEYNDMALQARPWQ